MNRSMMGLALAGGMTILVGCGASADTSPTADSVAPTSAGDSALTASNRYKFNDDAVISGYPDPWVKAHQGTTLHFVNKGHKAHKVYWSHGGGTLAETTNLNPGQSLNVTVKFGDDGYVIVYTGADPATAGDPPPAKVYSWVSIEQPVGPPENCETPSCSNGFG